MTKLSYTPIKTNRNNAIATVTQTMQEHSPIIISGQEINDFNANTTIGKSFLFRLNDWQQYLRINNMRAHHHNNHHRMRIDYQPRQILDGFDIYIFDEIHSFFPREGSFPEKEELMPFWEKVGRIIQANKKVIFITSLHPQSPYYAHFICAEEGWSYMGDFFGQYENSPALFALRSFFFAPVIELPKMYS